VCFKLADKDQATVVSFSQMRAFLRTFYAEARVWLVGLMGKLEDILGMNIAVLPATDTTFKVGWSEEPSLQRVFQELESRRTRQYSRMCAAFADFQQGGGAGMGLDDFQRWCATGDEGAKLRMLEWLKLLGDQWLQLISLCAEERDQHPANDHHGHWDHGPGHLSRTACQVRPFFLYAFE
jgi:hypothetical protein